MFDLMLYVPVNNFSVMPWCFLGWTSSKKRIKCLAREHKCPDLSHARDNVLSHIASGEARIWNLSISSPELYYLAPCIVLFVFFSIYFNAAFRQGKHCLPKY